MTPEQEPTAPTPGYQARCDCDDCIERQRGDEISRLVTNYPEKVQQAQRAIADVCTVVRDLVEAYDMQTAAGSDGADALAELDEVLRHMRNVRRIADARLALEKTRQIAYAINDGPEPEFDDDIAVSFTRDQVNEWAGRRLTDDELARLEEALPNSTFPETVGLIVGSMEATDEA
jgi:hypothetical protein